MARTLRLSPEAESAVAALASAENVSQNELISRAVLDYAAKRRLNLVLTRLVVNAVAPGTFNQWMALRGRLGGQGKVPRLSNDRAHLDSLLALHVSGHLVPKLLQVGALSFGIA